MTLHAPNRVKCIECSSQSGNGSLAEAWRGEHGRGPGAQPTPARRLGSPGGSGTRLQPGTKPGPGTRMLQTFMGTNSATAVSVSWQTMCPGSRLARESQKVAVNSRAPLQHSVSPQQLPGLAAACSPFPWVLGSWLTQPLDSASSPSRKPTWFLGKPFLWCFSSDAARNVSVPLGQKYKPALLQTKRYLPLLPQSLRKIVSQVSNPSPHTLFEKQNTSDGKSCHQSHTRTKPQSHKSRTSSHSSKARVGALLQKAQPTKAQSPLCLPACPTARLQPPAKPDTGTESSSSQPRVRPGGRSRKPQHREMLC